MVEFKYEALNSQGGLVSGTISSSDRQKAEEALIAKKLTIISLSGKKNKFNTKISLSKKTDTSQYKNTNKLKLSEKERVVLMLQLAVMVKAAIPIEEALANIKQDAPSEKAAFVIGDIREKIMQGNKFSTSAATFPKIFPPMYKGIIITGENTGNLGSALTRLSIMLEKNAQIMAQFLSAIAYPLVVFVALCSAIVFMLIYIVPKMVEQVLSIGAQLPLITKIVLGFSHLLTQYGLLILAFLVISIFIFIRALKQENFAYLFSKFQLSIPIIGTVFRSLDATRFSRSLSTMVASGVPLTDALRSAEKSLMNKYIIKSMEQVTSNVIEGGSFSVNLKQANVMPSMLCNLVTAGEKSGQIAIMLDKAAEYLESDFNKLMSVTLKMIEPIIMIVLGSVILLIMLAILLPTFSINNAAFSG